MIEHIIALSREAGAAIMQVYNGDKPLELDQKQDDSPVTTADLAAHRVIAAGLHALAPDTPLLSEEDPPDWSLRQHWRRFWLVDPLDGTKEFLRRNGEFTVNITLIEEGKPVIGVVYAPVTDRLYAAANGKAWRIDENGKQQTIEVKEARPPLVVVSRSHGNNAELQDYLAHLGEHQTVTIGSSLKFCLVAEGTAQLYPRFVPTNVWDTAAGHAVAVAAGAQVNDWQGRPLDYTPRESFLNPGFRVSLF
ncbi:3'(2'),5'-bisphosphate nucleotidase CysQ [Sodalis glossinidius str. 'morsitans']|uniref:3'(2'),5'-bisphosphate nucleotidase CysQ n=1 Tax=Sodalis glossinidius (strain morsitans) TaxID=343509 RepID=Q2NW50_SODGM|nr:3'(2'),5'-bisphosphate nucleotidase CysQ [Sodalis glossinidius]BAE73625.1 inositol monophosphatase family protein [Sodalis glossinidius str. 'morsitans']CRL44028.1 3'(2'),5'-bisphosphate nucleotidase CysQ [Sodalis glossinidius str. 'morsitans']